MKELTTMPVRVINGDKSMEVYEYDAGFAMATEFLGKCIGYGDPRTSMARLFRRHKDVLEQHRFVVTGDNKPQGGRATSFYDAKGCVKAVGLANTSQARVFLPRLVDYLDYLEKKRMARIEAYWFGKRPFWPEVRERVMKGEAFRQIGEAMGRSAASVRNAVSRMIEVGILQPMRAAAALTGPARSTVIRYGRKFIKDDRQLSLFDSAGAQRGPASA